MPNDHRKSGKAVVAASACNDLLAASDCTRKTAGVAAETRSPCRMREKGAEEVDENLRRAAASPDLDPTEMARARR